MVQEWLNELVIEMQNILKKLLLKCLAEGRNVDPMAFPSQILSLADSIMFTSKCEQAISGMTLSTLLDTYKVSLIKILNLKI